MEELSENQLKKFSSSKGMATKIWGPKLWDSLFIMILGAYPVSIDVSKKEHINIKKAFKTSLYNLRYTLPCSFCRNSFKDFLIELPIEPYTFSRISMMRWLYLIKDKVNKKLIKQEIEYKNDIYQKYKNKKIFKHEYDRLNNICFQTIPSPSFLSVLKKYEKFRANCNKKLKKCIIK